uniref:E3 ubiquitin-protein ligase n=1 Tax=Romanomermis culicivorax TaxID=13658 RepID=A0A915I7M2_ROMCU
ISAATTDADEFLIALIHKFNLGHWIASFESTRDFRDENNKVLSYIFDEFLQLLIVLIAERYTAKNVAWRTTTKDALRYLFVQKLCQGPTPFSKLERPPVGGNAGNC